MIWPPIAGGAFRRNGKRVLDRINRIINVCKTLEFWKIMSEERQFVEISRCDWFFEILVQP